MAYMKPKSRLHREFLYLDHETIVNSLSALEAGKVDEIIQKVNQAREGGFGAGIHAGPAEISGSKKKATNIEEELVRTRTTFSAYESWYSILKENSALGTLDNWTDAERDDLDIGDTIEFRGTLTLTPIHMLIQTYLAFAREAETPGSVFQQKGSALQDTKQSAKAMRGLIGGPTAATFYPVYIRPFGIDKPRMLGRLAEEFIIRPKDGIEGEYRIVAQVDQIIDSGSGVAAIRAIRDVPPTPLEIETVTEALKSFIEPAKEMGVDVSDDDIIVPPPVVVVRPIAVFR